ncbi:cupin [Variovorax gossypii]|uniref:Cupin n=1 Tax=Variovorax gossypii TaxID=1679495 RepID=A0A431THN0_9BURK|nr:cupin domain-containing protein [Variovorax gossypii]RTQ32864.1 cupin [Variovorax gossypii]
MQVRRVVAGIGADGRSRLFEDATAPRAVEFESSPGFAAALLWATGPAGQIERGAPRDRTATAAFVPGQGGTLLMFVTFPPDSTMMRADCDGAAFGEEFAQKIPGLAETFEADHPGMHTTDSIDYDVVLDGEITLELDDGAKVLLRRHDVAVQHGNRHAWRNLSDKPATMLFVLMGTKRAG